MTRMDDRDDGQAGLRQPLIDLALDGWRFARLFARVVDKLDEGERHRYANQLRYFMKRLDDSLASSGMSMVNLEGQPYDPGMAASALNVGDFEPDDALVVDQMMEPVLMGPDGVVKSGTLMLKRAQGGQGLTP